MSLGLQGVELGGQVIKRTIVDLLADFPRMNQFASLSPVPGFRDWLLDEIGTYVRLRGELLLHCFFYVTMTSFAITLGGQCCRLHVVGQQVVSDISVIRIVVEVFVVCVLNLIMLILLLRLLNDVLEASILHIQHGGVYLVIMHTQFSGVIPPYLYRVLRIGMC